MWDFSPAELSPSRQQAVWAPRAIMRQPTLLEGDHHEGSQLVKAIRDAGAADSIHGPVGD